MDSNSCRYRSSDFIKPKKFSITAFSKQLPLRLRRIFRSLSPLLILSYNNIQMLFKRVQTENKIAQGSVYDILNREANLHNNY